MVSHIVKKDLIVLTLQLLFNANMRALDVLGRLKRKKILNHARNYHLVKSIGPDEGG